MATLAMIGGDPESDRMLGRLAEIFPDVPRLAVTATADARTRADIRAELRLADALEFVDSFARPELALSEERKRGKAHGRVLELVAERPNRSGVIYAGARDGVDKLSQKPVAAGVPALAYHAGLELRAARLEQFLEAEASWRQLPLTHRTAQADHEPVRSLPSQRAGS